MQIAVVFLAFVACAMASDIIAKDFDPKKPLDQCKADGDFLLHPTNRCKYIRCTYGPEPWKDAEGNFKFFGVEQDCPYGTGVSRKFYGREGYGYDSYDNLKLIKSRLCAERVSRNYGHGNYGYGYDQCSVESHHGYGHAQGYAHQGYGNQGYAAHGYNNQGYVAKSYHGNGYAPRGYVQKGYVYPANPSYGKDDEDDKADKH